LRGFENAPHYFGPKVHLTWKMGFPDFFLLVDFLGLVTKSVAMSPEDSLFKVSSSASLMRSGREPPGGLSCGQRYHLYAVGLQLSEDVKASNAEAVMGISPQPHGHKIGAAVGFFFIDFENAFHTLEPIMPP